MIKKRIKLLMCARRMSLAVGINKFIRFLRSLPVIGKHVPDDYYAAKDGKTAVFIAVCAFKVFKKISLKFIYVGLILMLIPSIMPSFFEDDVTFAFNVDATMMMFFFTAFIGAALAFPKCISIDVKQDLVMIDKFHADPNMYMPMRIFEQKIIDFVFYLPCVIALSFSEKYSLLDGLLILVMLECVKVVFEALILLSFSPFKNLTAGVYKVIAYTAMFAGVAAAGVPIVLLAFGKVIDVKGLLINPISAIACAALAINAIVYILKYPRYRELAWGQVTYYNVAIEKGKQNQAQSRFGDARKWDKSAKNDSGVPADIEKLRGYDYFNALFFFRHRKYFNKKVILRTALVLVVTVGLTIAYLVNAQMITDIKNGGDISEILSGEEVADVEESSGDERSPLPTDSILPIFVFVAYAISIGRQATAAMFSNCDVSMLKYKFYRDKKVIISNFYVRLKKIMKLNAPIFLAMLTAVLALDAGMHPVSHTEVLTPARVLISAAAVAVMWLFFSFHDLFIYYILQPYNEEYATKKWSFTVVQVLVYVLCYMNIFIEFTNVYAYTAIIAAIALAYFALGMLAINKFGERNFKLN